MFPSRPHHVKDVVCLTRPPYRDGKKPRAVKVYTIAQESKYLLVQNLPAIGNALDELLLKFNQYGTIEQHWRLDGYEPIDADEFFDTILVKYRLIQQARIVKCQLDDWNFLGSNLHICYAPECESLDDVREKLADRRTISRRRSDINRRPSSMRPRRHTDLPAPPTVVVAPSFQRTTDEIRAKMRDIVQKSNLIPLVLQQELKKRKRIQI